ncbi:MAG: ABC transporter permease [Candidatus Heimdallarchaeota archaeon]|nr:ABC transporter permease [Candidatus Heimdallarchaeota archaeon]MDH5646473.1 ABC transporter permease [Candidatus Heimdallarchaeota archaeon]
MNKVNGSHMVLIKELQLLFKSKRRVFLLFFMPVLIILGGLISSASIYLVDEPIEKTNVWVLDQSDGEYSQDLRDMWIMINNTNYDTIEGEYDIILEKVEFEVFVFIPQNFTELFSANLTANIFVYHNANETRNLMVASSIIQITEMYDQNHVIQTNPDVQFNYINTNLDEVSAEGENRAADETLAQISVIIPIYIIFFVIISPISLVMISVTIEREQNTLETLFLQPVKRRSIILGKIYYGLSLILITLVLDVIAMVVDLFLITKAIESKGVFGTGNLFLEILKLFSILELLLFVFGIVIIASLIISMAVLLSLLAKDEKEANMISGMIPLIIMVMAVLIFIIPISDMSSTAKLFLSAVPVFGILVTIYLCFLAGGIVYYAYTTIIFQILWFFLIVTYTTRLSESESILELSFGKAVKELVKGIIRKK